MTGGEVITKVLAWASVAGYAAGVGALVLGRGRLAWDARARAAWTVGCAALLVHAACAFHFYHGWSHAEAYRDTARQTAEATGLGWGGGLYFNYALLAAWAADVACWWRGGLASYGRRPRLLVAASHAFLLFMFFNAAVVFGGGALRAASLGACAALFAAWLARRGGREASNEKRPAVVEE